MNAKSLSVFGRDVLLERVVVEMLVAVGEVRARDARRRALAGEVVLDPHLAALRAEAADHPVELGVALEPRLVAAEVPGLAREVLQRDVLDLGRRVDEQLDDGVRVGDRVGRRRREILDQREPRAFLGDHDHPPEERAAVRGHLDVERLLELDALRARGRAGRAPSARDSRQRTGRRRGSASAA